LESGIRFLSLLDEIFTLFNFIPHAFSGAGAIHSKI